MARFKWIERLCAVNTMKNIASDDVVVLRTRKFPVVHLVIL